MAVIEENTRSVSENQMKILMSTPQITVLRKCITGKIDNYKIKGKRNKKGAIIVQVSIIIFSVATTALIGWKTTDNRLLLTDLALLCSAVTAGINIFYNFFDYKDLWVHYKIALTELEAILHELDYREAAGAENITPQQLDLLYEKFVEICTSTNKNYQKIRLDKDIPPGDAKS